MQSNSLADEIHAFSAFGPHVAHFAADKNGVVEPNYLTWNSETGEFEGDCPASLWDIHITSVAGAQKFKNIVTRVKDVARKLRLKGEKTNIRANIEKKNEAFRIAMGLDPLFAAASALTQATNRILADTSQQVIEAQGVAIKLQGEMIGVLRDLLDEKNKTSKLEVQLAKARVMSGKSKGKSKDVSQ